ncbi:MAG TPA: N-acetylmuramoyl-L-alanine amidase [Vicinamibacterales bacterium]|nr:N-acetylmuramoyl-L-alanine amidase [Vicinamibacterales bacterium]
MSSLRTGVLLAALAWAGAQQAPTAAPYTVLSADGRRPLAARVINGQEMFALDDLAALFQLSVKEDALAGGLTVSTKTQTIVLTPGQSLASVAGRLISLPTPPVREGRSWFVPVDFLARALRDSLGTRLEVRKPSRLVLVGDIHVPRIAGTVEPQGSLARITLDVAPPAAHIVTQDGSRLVIKFEADGLDAALPASPAPDLVQAIRPGEGPASIVIDLGQRFASYRASDLPGDRGSVRIVIDVIAQTTATPPPAGVPATPPATPPAEPPPLLDIPPAGGIRTVVVDAGHGGTEDGARGPEGTLEKNVTLGVARRLKAALEARLGVRVILTRDGDATVGLDERAALANNNKADLFISLHANASIRGTAAGAEVFYLSLEEYGDQAQRVAKGETESLPVFGGGTRDIEVILWEMAQARYIEQSAVLAQAVEAALRGRVPMSPRAIQQAPFRVLVGANMPAVLVEMGFITNPDQERQLGTEGFQSSIVQALVDSVARYRDLAATRTSGALAAPQAPAPLRPGGGGIRH